MPLIIYLVKEIYIYVDITRKEVYHIRSLSDVVFDCLDFSVFCICRTRSKRLSGYVNEINDLDITTVIRKYLILNDYQLKRV